MARAKKHSQSESDIRDVINHVRDILYRFDPKTARFTFINKAITVITGYSNRPLSRVQMRERIHPDDRAHVRAYWNEILQKGSRASQKEITFRVKTKSGTYIWLSESHRIVRDKRGNVLEVVGAARDVTAEQEAEETLREAKVRAETYLNIAGSMIVALDGDGKITLMNRRGYEILGYPEGSLIGKNWFQTCIPPEMRKRVQTVFRGLMNEVVEPFERYENAILTKRGKERTIEFYNQLIRDERGKIIGTLSSGEDVTERKKMEEEREAALERVKHERDNIQTIVNSMGDGLFVINTKLEIVLMNRAAERMSAWDRELVIGKRYDEIFTFVFEKDRTSSDSFIKETLETGRMQHEPVNHSLLLNREKEEISVATTAAPLLDKDNDVTGCVIVFRNVTREREIDRLKTEFVSVATHQLQTPLTGMKWFLELVLAGRAGALTHKQAEYLRHVNDSNDRMIRLINDLLSVSRIESGSAFTPNPTSFNLIPVIRQLITDNVAIAKSVGVHVKRLHLPKHLTVYADEPNVRMAIGNVINNAIRYSREGGLVEISCDASNPKEAVLTVRDNGVGIPRSKQHRVFEKFFRAPNALTKMPDGTGLGLYIAKAVIEAHGGRIWFQSREGKGTTFYVAIPRTQKRAITPGRH